MWKLGVKSSSPRDTAISCREREKPLYGELSLVLTIQFSKCPGLSFHGVIVSSSLPAHLLSQWSCSWNWSVAETGNINPYFTACLWSKLGFPRVYILFTIHIYILLCVAHKSIKFHRQCLLWLYNNADFDSENLNPAVYNSVQQSCSSFFEYKIFKQVKNKLAIIL